MQAVETTRPRQAQGKPLMVEMSSMAANPRRLVTWVARALTYLLYFYVLLVEAVLLLGFFLLVFGANPSAPFTRWAYRNLEAAMEPFRGIFAPIKLGVATNDVPTVFDTSILFAMVVYGVLAIAMNTVIAWLTTRLTKIERIEAIEHARAQAEASRWTTPPPTPTPTAPGERESQLSPDPERDEAQALDDPAELDRAPSLDDG